MNNQANTNTDDRSASVLSDRLSVIRSWYTERLGYVRAWQCSCGSIEGMEHHAWCPVGMVGDLLARIDREPESDPVLGQAVAAYMRNEMAMPDFDLDQEQNWIAGHLFTFTKRQVADLSARVETLQSERDAFRDEANAIRRNYLAETRDLATRADAAEAEVARLRALSDWKPIKTAPKDGTEVIVWPLRVFAYWHDECATWVASEDGCGIDPTHWYTAPPVPASSQE